MMDLDAKRHAAREQLDWCFSNLGELVRALPCPCCVVRIVLLMVGCVAAVFAISFKLAWWTTLASTRRLVGRA